MRLWILNSIKFCYYFQELGHDAKKGEKQLDPDPDENQLNPDDQDPDDPDDNGQSNPDVNGQSNPDVNPGQSNPDAARTLHFQSTHVANISQSTSEILSEQKSAESNPEDEDLEKEEMIEQTGCIYSN